MTIHAKIVNLTSIHFVLLFFIIRSGTPLVMTLKGEGVSFLYRDRNRDMV